MSAAVPVVSYVLGGGAGSRLWPLSRAECPKPFQRLTGGDTLLAATVRRQARRAGAVHVIVQRRHAWRMRAEPNAAAGRGDILYEPEGRGTAAAVAVATLHARRHGPGALVLIAPADHAISCADAYWRSVEAGMRAARDGAIVLFGIVPDRAETGYGYVEAGPETGGISSVRRFVEKPDAATARGFLGGSGFYWNSGIFLFRADIMAEALAEHAPRIWSAAQKAVNMATADRSGLWLDAAAYAAMPVASIDRAVMEKSANLSMVRAGFGWSDLGTWQSLHRAGAADACGNVVSGDVVADDCSGSLLRSEGPLLAATGLRDIAVVVTADAVLVAPLAGSQGVGRIVETLERTGRREARSMPAEAEAPGAWRRPARHWLFERALPLWAERGVDRMHGGFHEALQPDGSPVARPKRIRTMARQIYAFAMASRRGADGAMLEAVSAGIDFLVTRARTRNGGYCRLLSARGGVLDPAEDLYDQAFVLLALAHAHAAGHADALRLGQDLLAFLDTQLADPHAGGYREQAGRHGPPRRSNPHMHLLEAFLAWHELTGDAACLGRCRDIAGLLRRHYFDAGRWSLGEWFGADWQLAPGPAGRWTEPGHYFEWASLLIEYARPANEPEIGPLARRLYASAAAFGVDRATGLAYCAVSRDGAALDRTSRSWAQTEAVKAAIALDGAGGLDLQPEIEARMRRLFRWHIDPAPPGLWIDWLDAAGRPLSADVPASILYHLVAAITRYLDHAGDDDTDVPRDRATDPPVAGQ